jgi:hypothetical protein
LTDGEARGVVEGHTLHGVERLGTVEADIAHVADVKESYGSADGHVLGD